MITEAQRATIRRLFYAEHWPVGTIAREVGLHAETVRAALETKRFIARAQPRPRSSIPISTSSVKHSSNTRGCGRHASTR